MTISADAVAKTNAIKALPGFRSLPGTAAVSGNLSIVNQTNGNVTIWWDDIDGPPDRMGALQSGDNTAFTPIYFGGMFTINDSNGNLLEMYVVSDLPTTH